MWGEKIVKIVEAGKQNRSASWGAPCGDRRREGRWKNLLAAYLPLPRIPSLGIYTIAKSESFADKESTTDMPFLIDVYSWRRQEADMRLPTSSYRGVVCCTFFFFSCIIDDCSPCSKVLERYKCLGSILVGLGAAILDTRRARH